MLATMHLFNRIHLTILSSLAALAAADFHVLNCEDNLQEGTQYLSVAVPSKYYGCNWEDFYNIELTNALATDVTSWDIHSLCGDDSITASLDASIGHYNLTGSDGSDLGYCNPMSPQGLMSGCGASRTCTDVLVCYSPKCN